KRLPEFIAYASRFGNVHLHDNKGVVDDHLTLGDGEVPWKDAVRALVDSGYGGTFVIESRDHASGRASQALLAAQLRRST
ncbi:MAG TPA: TIM barrel protein, partial [Candidatus Thermoplasmatota archaeon]|nr:TIM barrel protein [Candidatus Thermoplasmatota archaeon]